MTGIIPGLDHQLMDPLQLIVQGPVEGNHARFDVHHKVAIGITLAPVDFIQHQAVIALVFICGKYL